MKKISKRIENISDINGKPDVLISKEGSASFSFYTADSSSKYHILIEGVTSDGQLIHKYSTINVR